VLPDGSVGRVAVVKSLDGSFGLDAEAVKAARQWRFTPGTGLASRWPYLSSSTWSSGFDDTPPRRSIE
jgi:TonB family protein